MNDEILLQQAGRGDREAFAELVARYQEPVVAFIQRYLRNPDVQTAEDLAQSVFLAAWQGAGRFKPRARVKTWLYRMAINACLNERRRLRVRRQVRLDDGEDRGDRGGVHNMKHAYARRGSPDEVHEMQEAVRSALEALPESQRAVVVLRHYHDLPYREIAEVMEISVGAVESLLFRARQNLRARLLPGFDDSPPQGTGG
ncbi:MAG: sigma-70 family RNA polymerase sigma factor [Phycisphaerales bacterium]|nr:sigma-70 family RNA polymerase sigma factor [Phycisphaerales bacterium]